MFILSIHRSVYFFYLPSFPTRRSSDLSLSLPDRLLVGRKGPILQITFRGESAEESVISETIDKFDVSINILHGKITDRKSTRLNSSHVAISYAVFCLKKKKNDMSKITC